jgi:hypothetical protein
MSKAKDAKTCIEDVFRQVDEAPFIMAEQLRVWGGEFDEKELTVFLQAWDDTPEGYFSWAIVEEVSRFYVLAIRKPEQATPPRPALLERLRVFGEQGDLDIRRDGDTFRWRLIGAESPNWPTLAGFQPEDFWQFVPETKPVFREVAKNYFQWRPHDQRVSDQWRGDTTLADKDIVLEQRQYLDNGRIAFVRYVGFKEA